MSSARGAWLLTAPARSPRGLLLLLSLGAIWGAGLAHGAGQTVENTQALTLFQRVARSELIAHVRTHDGALRYAVVDILETFKGKSPVSRIRIAFRDINFQRTAGVEPIIFPNGREEVLLLAPHRSSRRRQDKDRDLFDLVGGADGRISVPAEGSGQLLAAVRQLASFSGEDPVTQVDRLTRLLDDTNLLLVEAALDELDRLQAANPSHYVRLVGLLSRPSPRIRVRALRLIGTTFSQFGVGRDDSPDDADAGPVLVAVAERARNDPDESARVAAVEAMAAWPRREEVIGDLRAIASNDPAQAVRYEAERAIFRGSPK